MFWLRVAWEAIRFAFYAHGQGWRYLQGLFWLVALGAPFSTTTEATVTFHFAQPTTWSAKVGVLASIIMILVLVAMAIVFAVCTTTRLTFLDDRMDLGTWKQHYGVMVQNGSVLKTIKNCRLRLSWSEPRLPDLPLTLHCSGADLTEKEEAPIDMAPRVTRKWDVVRPDDNEPEKWIIAGSSVAHRVQLLPHVVYQVTVSAEGDDVPVTDRHFLIGQNEDGSLRFDVIGSRWKHSNEPIPTLGGKWFCFDRKRQAFAENPCFLKQTGRNVALTNEHNDKDTGEITGSRIVCRKWGGHNKLIGAIPEKDQRIEWTDNETVWTRTRDIPPPPGEESVMTYLAASSQAGQ